ncbi:hypothetical protein HDU92_008378 [Lobulomyces angularis]|nr:hypothetical protein HDU92_008378 [Lobulomyces angularis]
MQVENVENLLLYEIILLSTYKPEDSKDLLRKYLEKKKNNKSRWSFSSILNKTLTSDSIPKPLIKIINKVKYNWSLKLDYSGNYLAVFSENFLEIRNSQNHFSHPIKTLLRPDAYPNLRKISWSYDSKLIAVSYSDGCITVIKNSGQVLCTIKSNTDVVLNGKTSFEKKDFIGFLDPVAVLGIVNPKTLRKCVNDLEESHELISIDFSGYLRSYRFKLEDIDTKSSLKVNISDLEIFSLGTQIYREDKDNNNVLKFSHSFNFGFHYRTLYTGMIDCETLVLVGEVSSNNVVDTFSEWICLNKFPFYQLKSYNNQEFLSSSLNSKSKSIFNAFIRQSVSYLPRHLTSMEESIHTIELSPTGSKFLVVENPGNLKIFQRKPLKLLNEFHNDEILAMTGVLNNKATRFARSTEQENIGTSHNSTDAARSILSVAGWWSEDDVILSFTDGSLVIAKLPTLTNVLGSNAEKFYAPLSLQCRQGEGVFVLENKSETIRYRLSPNNTYVLVRRLDVTESSLQNTMNSKLAFLMKFSTIPLRLFMNAFLGDWEESEVSDIITFQQHQFSLYYIMKSTPLEAMYLKIQLKKYGAALDLAKLYNLDEDPIYKAQWLDLEVDEYSIKDYLSKIHEKDWVLQKCASRVPNNVKNAKLLLQYGLKLTNHITMVDVENEINEVLEEFEGPMSSVRNFTTSQETLADVKKVPVHTICKYRLLFLKYIDRLETHVSIYSPAKIFPSVLDQEALQPFDVHFFQFRDINLIELALNFAINGFVHGLEVLFTRYTEEVLPYRTMILNHFPETYSPVLYTILLPEVEAETEVLWKSIPWRKKDWTENENILEFAGWESEHFEGECGEIYPNTGSHIRQWYDNRARFIEENSGQVDLALELVELGIQKKVKGLSLLRTHLKILFYLVYDESFHCLEVDLSKLESMSHMEIYNLILTETNERNIVEKVKKIILPYIQETDKYSTGCEQIFYACLENASRNHLNWFISLLEGKSFFEPVLFGSPDLIADLILKCCYISEEQEDLDKSYLRILNCIPLINKKSSSTELNGWDHETNLNEEFNVILREKIDLLSMHIRAWEILRFYNLQTPLKWFLESQNIELQRKLLVKLARNAGEIKLRFRYFDTDNKFWNTLLERLLELRELKILNLLKLEDIFSEYFVVALNHGKFDLIADLLKRAEVIDNLPFKTIEKLVLDAATESFDNSTSCNMHTGELMMATNCLKLLPESTACQRELALIEAIHQLGLLKVPLKSHQDADSLLLPIQIRLHPNRLELIQQALGLNKQYYVSAGLVIDLSKKLLGAATPIPKVKALIADSALDSSDVEVAWRLCKDLIGDLSFQGNTWRVCLRLAQHSKFRDVDKKLLLVSHVLKCCPSSSLHEALTLWKNLDLEKVKSNDLGLKSSPLNDSASSETLSSFLHKGLSEYSSFSTLKSASSPLKKELVPKLLDSTSTFSPAKNFSDIYNLIEQNLSSPTASSPTRVKNNVNLDALKFKYSFVNFYAPPQCLDINKNETVFNEQKYLERIYLERLLRLNELKKENNEICNDVTQEILENLCSIFLTMDFPYGIGYLLSLTYPTVQYKYLNSLEQNEHVEKLGCYLFSLSACLEITKQKNVFSCKPVDLVSIIENIDSKTFNKHSIAEKCFFATKFLDSLKSKRDIRLLNSLIANSSRKEDARSSRLEASDYRKKDDFKGTLKIKNKNFQEDVLLEGFEMEKFNDENYKKCFMIGLIETFDLKKLEDILKVSGEFGVERKMLLLSYFKWIFTTPHADNDSITKIIDLYQNELLLINDALDVISSVHSNVSDKCHDNLFFRYLEPPMKNC